MISQAVNQITLNLLWGDAFITVYAELAGRRIERTAVCLGLSNAYERGRRARWILAVAAAGSINDRHSP
jgi:hypothetical protein